MPDVAKYLRVYNIVQVEMVKEPILEEKTFTFYKRKTLFEQRNF
jgi:hypothetical protein